MFNTEKIIKQQARQALRGNLSQLIAAAGSVVTVYLAVQYANYMVYFSLKNLDVTQIGLLSAETLFALGTAVMLLLCSPLLNGFLRASANTALQKDCGARDVLFYFKKTELYFKTLLINLLVYMLFSITSTALNVSMYLEKLAPSVTDPAVFGFTPQGFAVVFAAVLTVIISIFLYMFFVHFPLMSYALNENQGVGRCVFVTMGFSFRNFGKLLRLMLSFAGWFALCFFVLPILYVLPYFSVASLLSARWLFDLDESRGAV